MGKLAVIISREVSTRLRQKWFWITALAAPVLLLGGLWLGGIFSMEDDRVYQVLVEDPYDIMATNIPNLDTKRDIEFSFVTAEVDNESFLKDEMYKDFDVKIEVPKNVITHNVVVAHYRNVPPVRARNYISAMIEARIKEYKVTLDTNLNWEDFKRLEQPLMWEEHDLLKNENLKDRTARKWVGLFFGTLVLLFILVYVGQIYRGVLEEKSTRIIEVIASSVSPGKILWGKLLGITFVSLIQFTVWAVLVGVGLFVMKNTLFPDIYTPENWQEASGMISTGAESAGKPNYYAELLFERINFPLMVGCFFVFFIGGYFLYGSLVAALASATNRGSDMQGVILPILIPLLLGAILVFAIEDPNSGLVRWASMFPLTSPVVMPVRVAFGLPEGSSWEFYMAIGLLVLTFLVVLAMSARIYRKGILHQGGRASIKSVFRWIMGK